MAAWQRIASHILKAGRTTTIAAGQETAIAVRLILFMATTTDVALSHAFLKDVYQFACDGLSIREALVRWETLG